MRCALRGGGVFKRTDQVTEGGHGHFAVGIFREFAQTALAGKIGQRSVKAWQEIVVQRHLWCSVVLSAAAHTYSAQEKSLLGAGFFCDPECG